jgi:hypothetical protein
MPILPKLFHEIEREETLPNSFCKASITLTPELGTKKLQINFFDKHGCKNSQ